MDTKMSSPPIASKIVLDRRAVLQGGSTGRRARRTLGSPTVDVPPPPRERLLVPARADEREERLLQRGALRDAPEDVEEDHAEEAAPATSIRRRRGPG